MATQDLSVNVKFVFPSQKITQTALDAKYRNLKLPVELKLPGVTALQTILDVKYRNLKLKVDLRLDTKAVSLLKADFLERTASTNLRLEVTPSVTRASLRKFKELTTLALKGDPLKIPVVLDFKEGKAAIGEAGALAAARKAEDLLSRTSVGLRFSGGQLKPIASIFDPRNVAIIGTLGIGIAGVGSAFALAATQGAALNRELQIAGALSGASARELGKLKDTILSVSTSSIGASFSPKEIAEAAKEAVKAGLSIQQTIQTLRPAQILASLGDTTLSDSILTISKTLNIFGLAGDQAGRVARLIAGAAGTTQASVKDISDAFVRAAPNAKLFGVGIDDVAGALKLLAKNGIIGNTAGVQLSNIFTKLSGTTQVARKELERLGVDPFSGPNRSFIGLTKFFEQYSAALKNATEEQKAFSVQSVFGSGGRGGRNAVLTLIDEFNKGNTIDEAIKSFEGYSTRLIKATDNLSQAGSRVKNTFLSVFADLGSRANFAEPVIAGLDTIRRELLSFENQKVLEKAFAPLGGILDVGASGFFAAFRESAPFFSNFSDQIKESVEPLNDLALGIGNVVAGFGSGFTTGFQVGAEILGDFGKVAAAIPEVLQRIAGQLTGGFFVGKLLQNALTVPQSVTASLEQYELAVQRVARASEAARTARANLASRSVLQGLAVEYRAASAEVDRLSTSLLRANQVAAGVSRVLPALGAAAGLLGDNSEAAAGAVTALYIGLEAFYALQGLSGVLKGVQSGIAGVGLASAASSASATAGAASSMSAAAGAASGLAGTLGTAVPIIGGVLAAGAAAFAIFGSGADEASAAITAFGDAFVEAQQTLAATGVKDISGLSKSFIDELDESNNLKEFKEFFKSSVGKDVFGGEAKFFKDFSAAALAIRTDMTLAFGLIKKLDKEGKGFTFRNVVPNGRYPLSLGLEDALEKGLSTKEFNQLIKAKITGKEIKVDLNGVKFSSKNLELTGIAEDSVKLLREAYKRAGDEGFNEELLKLDETVQTQLKRVAISDAKRTAQTIVDAQNEIFPQFLSAGFASINDIDNSEFASTLLAKFQLNPQDEEELKKAYAESFTQLKTNLTTTLEGILPSPTDLINSAFNQDTKKIDFKKFKENIDTAITDFNNQLELSKVLVAFGFKNLGSYILGQSPEIAKALRDAIKNGTANPQTLSELETSLKEYFTLVPKATEKILSDPELLAQFQAGGAGFIKGLFPSLTPQQIDEVATAVAQDAKAITDKVPEKIKEFKKEIQPLDPLDPLGIFLDPINPFPTPTEPATPTNPNTSTTAGNEAGTAFNDGVTETVTQLNVPLGEIIAAQFSAAISAIIPLIRLASTFLGDNILLGATDGLTASTTTFTTTIITTMSNSVTTSIPYTQLAGQFLGDSIAAGTIEGFNLAIPILTDNMISGVSAAITATQPFTVSAATQLGVAIANGINTGVSSELRITQIVNSAIAKIKTKLDALIGGTGTIPAKRQGGAINFGDRTSGLVLMHHGEGVLPPETMRALGAETFEALRTRSWLPNRRIGEKLYGTTMSSTTTYGSQVSNVSTTHQTSSSTQNVTQNFYVTAPAASDPHNIALLLSSKVRGQMSRLSRGR